MTASIILPRGFADFLSELKAKHHLDFEGVLLPALVNRVQRQMRRIGVEGYQEYLTLLRDRKDELADLLQVALTHTEGFFRTPGAWQYLVTGILPRLLEESTPRRPIRIWCVGCGSGEGAYAPAIALAAALEPREFRNRVRIYATDTRDEILHRAARSRHQVKDFPAIPPSLVETHLCLSGNREDSHDVRTSIVFGRHDVLHDPPIGHIDLLICRLRLPLFERNARSRILSAFRYSVSHGGYLFLWDGARLLADSKDFVRVDRDWPLFIAAPSGGMRNRLTVARSQLEMERRSYQDLFDFAPDGYLVTDMKGEIRYANRAAATLLEIDRRLLPGRRFADFVTAGEQEELVARLDRLANDESPREWEVQLGPADGTPRTASLTVSMMRNTRGRPVMIRWMLHDISERKRAEDKLARLSRQIELILNSMAEGIYGLDVHGQVTFINGSAARMLGYQAEELVGGPIHDPRHHAKPSGESYPEGQCPILAALRDGIPRHVTTEPFWRKDGATFLAEYSCMPIRENDRLVGIVVTFEDVTERRREEHEAKERQAHLAHAQRLTTIGEMTAAIAHELNQPLAAIRNYSAGCSRRLERDGFKSNGIHTALEAISAQALRAAEILRRMRGFVRKESPRRETVNLNQLVREAVGLLEPEARAAGIAVRLELAPAIYGVRADPVQIEQVILNLVKNGIEAMTGRDGRQRQLSIRTELLDGDRAEVSVRDQGGGLAAEVADKVFDPFFTTKATGLGMGLSISRSIAEAHGGRLWATSDEPGATFRLTLPIFEGD